jgi:uncharacterized protein YecT (DUF1311 family)
MRSFAYSEQKKITENELKQHIAKTSGCEEDQINLDDVNYSPLTGRGVEDAIVVASTCNTGTAGSDIHSVYARAKDGTLEELQIQKPEDTAYEGLIGRVFSDLQPEDGLLVERFTDTSHRDDPLVIKYRWNSKTYQFVPVRVTKPPRFRTSYDCNKAHGDVENAICYVKWLADSDRELDASYKTLLAKLDPGMRAQLVAEQKDWLRQRNTGCDGWMIVDCLDDLYKKRIEELKTRLANLPNK